MDKIDVSAIRKRKLVRHISEGIKAEGHTPIYKFHKYFARRPHNVFAHLIDFYTNDGDLIWDCFAGGGVTLVEGVKQNRRVFATDVNPLAVFVSESQLTYASLAAFDVYSSEIANRFEELVGKWYKTECRSCKHDADVRWYEHAYLVNCPSCSVLTPLANDNKFIKNGKSVNGQYSCKSCQAQIKAADIIRQSEKMLSVRYKCNSCGIEEATLPNDGDELLKSELELNFQKVVQEYDLNIPADEIPEFWDRQQEDCLHRKGFLKFSDFFTKRNLLATALLKKLIVNEQHKLPTEHYRMLIFAFSATLRYLNNLNFSTDSWMGGRPVAWAKHAFWTPNQFVEVSPVEYFRKRLKAFKSSLEYQNQHLSHSRKASSTTSLVNSNGTHFVSCQSSISTDLPDKSVDAVITDPPYGSNVQYGELSSFWLVWLQDVIEYCADPLAIDNEVLTHRKTKSKEYSKSFDDYYNGCLSIFKECHRVLKDDAPLVFTFNNRNLKAWYSVIKAALNAGFVLEDDSVIYQEPIEIYKDTAHARYDGALQGDFIYSFRKVDSRTSLSNFSDLNLKQVVLDSAKELKKIKGAFTDRELHIFILPKVISLMADIAIASERLEDIKNEIECENLHSILSTSKSFFFEQGLWKSRV